MSAVIAALTDPGRKRATNEDRVLVEELPDGSVLLVVADGVGGLAHGELASEHAVRAVHDELASADIDDPAAALARAFAHANQSVRRVAAEQPGGAAIATTLVASFVRDHQVWVGNVGDSRAYLFKDDQLEQLTQDHSVVAEQVRAGVITDEEAEASQYGNVITRGIGVDDTVQADCAGPFALPAGAIVLLCSDGLYRPVTQQQITAVLSSGTPQEMTRQLVDLANEAGGPDNISAAIMRQGA